MAAALPLAALQQPFWYWLVLGGAVLLLLFFLAGLVRSRGRKRAARARARPAAPSASGHGTPDVAARGTARSTYSPYRRKRTLFSHNERRFFEALCRAVEPRYRVFSRMRVTELLFNSKEAPVKDELTEVLSRATAGFVLLERTIMAPRLIVELAGAGQTAHLSEREMGLLVQAYAAAGLPLLRFPAAPDYAEADLHQAIEAALAAAGGQLPAAAVLAPATAATAAAAAEEELAHDDPPLAPAAALAAVTAAQASAAGEQPESGRTPDPETEIPLRVVPGDYQRPGRSERRRRRRR